MKIFQVLLIIILAFILNIGLYFLNDDYKMFLKWLKQEPSESEDILTDDYNINVQDEDDLLEKELKKSFSFLKKESFIEWKIEEVAIPKKNNGKEVEMSENNLKILQSFSWYKLIELKAHQDLLDVNDQYPDDYFEYYSSDLTMVFFPTKDYDWVKEIFKLVSYWKKYTLNELNNFGESSFYINLPEALDDWFVRIVLTKNWSTFWLKIKKNQYNQIKKKLQSL